MFTIFKSDPEKSLKDNILKGFVPIMVLSLLVSAAVLITLVVVTNNVAISESESSLIDQITRQAKAVSAENSELLNQRLTRFLQGGVSPIVYATTDTTRSGYSQGYLPSFFDFNPDPPLVTDSRHRIPVSFSHSTYYFPGTTESSIGTFTKQQNETRDNSTHLDNFFPNIYNNYQHLIQSYVGYEENGMWRRYPGNFTKDRSYDPRARSWYIAATDSTSGYDVSDPYQDFNIQEWMITVAQQIYDNLGTFIGVAGSDLTIDNLRDIIDSVLFLDSGKVSIFQTDGIVVADQEWSMDKTDPIGYTYQDLTNPRISTGTWESITSIEPGQTKVHNFNSGGDDYLVITTNLDSFNGKYLVSVFIKESDITKPIEPTLQKLEDNGTTSIIILVVIAVVVSAFMGIVIYYTAIQIVEPLNGAKTNLDALVMSLGGPQGSGNNFVSVKGGLGTETDEFIEEQRNFTAYLEEKKAKAAKGDQVQSIWFNGENQQYFNIVPTMQLFPQGFVQPSAPLEFQVVQAVPVTMNPPPYNTAYAAVAGDESKSQL